MKYDWANEIPVDSELVNRWDQEWLNYFLTESVRPFFVPHTRLKRVDSLEKKSANQIYDTALTKEDNGVLMPHLNIWVNYDDILNKNVFELGCGPGFLGKQLGMVAKSYLGIDYSELALKIAHLVSPDNCKYVHISDFDEISKYEGTIDTMVGRYFFIHQNYNNLTWILRLAHFLLKDSGVISADFYLPDPNIPQGIVHPAKHELDDHYASCAFAFTDAEIHLASQMLRFKVENIVDRLDLQRKFVFFRKLSA